MKIISRQAFKYFEMKLLLIILCATGLTSLGFAQDKPASQPAPSAQSTSTQNSSMPRKGSSAAAASANEKQKTFPSAQDAANALYEAASKHDENLMLVILGPKSNDVIMWTKDPAERRSDIDLFVQKYRQMHRLVEEPDNETTLYIGAENWPMPIPLVQRGKDWYFDSDLGRQEIVYRRIGKNELDTIDTLHAMVDAENDFYAQMTDMPDGPQYASKFDCTPGKHDGLYFPNAKKMDESPIGPYLAQASFSRQDHKPLSGYYFRILAEQGPKARGGARKYIVNGKMTGGFAFVAFPAEYRSSGVKTFIIDQNDVVYEKDLGPQTMDIAKNMTAYNPDSSWTIVQ
ncbi:MAG TPA: DUF2950 domain-containing protein [Candidatus Saccharimonadales bacterium]|nr:DUF2950 domain-containing protein [Candidatus Saccharimonadales bacterium]